MFVARSAGRALCNVSRQLKSPDRADAVVGVFGVGSGFANSVNRPAGPGRYWDELDKFWNGLDQESETAGDCEYARAGLSSPGI